MFNPLEEGNTGSSTPADTLSLIELAAMTARPPFSSSGKLMKKATKSAVQLNEMDASFTDLATQLALAQGVLMSNSVDNVDAISADVTSALAFAKTALNGLDPVRPPTLDSHVRGALDAALSDALDFQDSLDEQCDVSTASVSQQSDDIKKELRGIQELGVKLVKGLDSMSVATWAAAEDADGEDTETKIAEDADKHLASLIKTAKLRDVATMHLKKAAGIAEALKKKLSSPRRANT